MSDFNEAGNPQHGGLIETCGKKIDKLVAETMKDLIDNGATYIELRAACQYLSGCVDICFSEFLLRTQWKNRKVKPK